MSATHGHDDDFLHKGPISQKKSSGGFDCWVVVNGQEVFPAEYIDPPQENESDKNCLPTDNIE
jgi:hypothetical protein